MNLNEYIKRRKEDIRAYLKDINYENLERENAVEGLPEEIDLMFNKNPIYRKETDRFVIAVKNAYDHLVDDELEFASDIKEVEGYIHEFEMSLKSLVKLFKNNILILFNRETKYKVNIINNDLSFIQIRIRKREEKLSSDEIHKLNELSGFKEIIYCIYTLIYEIKDKSIKSSNLLDLINMTYNVGSPEYTEAMNNFMGIVLNEKNYDNFIKLYEEEMEVLTGTDKERKNSGQYRS